MTAINGHTHSITLESNPPITDDLTEVFQELHSSNFATDHDLESPFISSTNSETRISISSINSNSSSDNSAFFTASSRQLQPCMCLTYNENHSLPDDMAVKI